MTRGPSKVQGYTLGDNSITDRYTAWAVKVEEAIAATKNKAKANKEKRAKHRVQTKTGKLVEFNLFHVVWH